MKDKSNDNDDSDDDEVGGGFTQIHPGRGNARKRMLRDKES
jgi:hypothetical protein